MTELTITSMNLSDVSFISFLVSNRKSSFYLKITSFNVFHVTNTETGYFMSISNAENVYLTNLSIFDSDFGKV